MKKDINYKFDLPNKGVIFLGGHQNMTKKLRQYFPKWNYISDEQLKRNTPVNTKVVFYWTAHSSHKIMRYVYRKLPESTNIVYVSSTNISLLINEMQVSYSTIS